MNSNKRLSDGARWLGAFGGVLSLILWHYEKHLSGLGGLVWFAFLANMTNGLLMINNKVRSSIIAANCLAFIVAIGFIFRTGDLLAVSVEVPKSLALLSQGYVVFGTGYLALLFMSCLRKSRDAEVPR